MSDVKLPPRYNITQTVTNKPHHLNAHMVEHPHGDYMESRYYDELCAGAGELLRALEFNWVDCGPEKNCFECDMKRTAIARAKEAGIE